MILDGAVYPDTGQFTMAHYKDIERYAPPNYLVYESTVSVLYPTLGPNNYTTYPSGFLSWNTETFFQDFYFKINVFPSRENLGSISSSVTRQVLVWNGYLENNALETIQVTGDNTDITTGFSPSTYLPLEEREYQVQVGIDGPATFDVTYNLQFEMGVGLYNIVGQRIVSFTFKPDWSEGVTEVYEYVTSIDRSYSGKEDRASVRSVPERSLEFRTRAYEGDVERFDQLMWESLSRTLAIPLWTHGTFFEDIPTGTLELYLDTTDKGYQDSVIITSSARDDAIYQIEQILDDRIVLPEPTSRWTNAVVAPVRFVFAGETVETRRLSSQLLENRTHLIVDKHDPWIGGYNIDTQFNGKPVWLYKPNRARSSNFDYNIDWFDYSNTVGNTQRRAKNDNVRSQRSYDFVFNGRGIIYEFHKFFNWAKGKANTFYMPLWERSMTVQKNVISGENSVIVRNIKYENSYDWGVNRHAIAIYLKEEGSWLLRPIENFNESEDTTELVFSEPLPNDIDKDNMVVFFMENVRFASDRVEMTWRKTDLLETNMGFVSVDE